MRKALIALAAVLAVALLALLTLPLLFKDKLVQLAVDQVEEQIDAQVSLGDADATLFEAFPDLTVTLSDVVLDGQGAFEGTRLAEAGSLSLTVDLNSVLSGEEVVLRAFTLSDATVNVHVDADGHSNIDLVPASEDDDVAPAGEPTRLQVERYALERVQLNYADAQADRALHIRDLNHQGNGRWSGSVLQLGTLTEAASVSLRDGPAQWLDDTALLADFAMVMDTESGNITFGDNSVRLNDLPLAFAGSIWPQDDGQLLDLSFSATETAFKSLLSMVPSLYKGELSAIDSAGTLALSGSVKGLLPSEGDDVPAFNLTARVDGGRFHFPDLPRVDAVDLDLVATHPGGALDLAVFDLKSFMLSVGGEPITGRLRVTHPKTDPDLNLAFKGSLNLATLREALGEEEKDYSGTLEADLSMAGRASTFSAGRGDKVNGQGFLRLRDVAYKAPDMPHTWYIDQLDLGIEPTHVAIDALNTRVGRSDMQVSGRLDTLLGWLFADAPLEGSLALTGQVLDVADLLGEGDEDAPEEDASGVAQVPSGYTLTLPLNFGRVYYDDYVLDRVRGTVQLRDGELVLDGLRLNTLGGDVSLTGSYASPSDQAADVDMSVSLSGFNVASVMELSDTLQRIAPVAKGAQGSFGTDFRITTRMDPEGLVLDSLNSAGLLQAIDLRLEPKFMSLLGSQLKNDDFKKLTLGNTNLPFTIQNGKLRIRDVPVTVGGVSATLSGATGLISQEHDLRLSMKLPTSQIKASELLGRLGVSKGGTVDLLGLITGSWTDPKLRLDTGDLQEAVKDAVMSEVTTHVDAAKAEATAQVDQALTQLLSDAEAQGDRMIAQAELAGDRVRAEATRAGDLLVDEAKKKAKKLRREGRGNPLTEAAADRAADKLVDEAKASKRKLERQANQKANALVREATDKKEGLMAEARLKAGK